MANILVAISGGTRAPTAIELGRRFVDDGHVVRFVATDAAMRFLRPHLARNPRLLPFFLRRFRPATFERLAYIPEKPPTVPHLAEGRWADTVLVCPATSNTVGRIAAGLADNFLLQILRGVTRGKRVLVVPSMNPEMWFDPSIQRNIDLLNSTQKYRVLCPARGRMLSGDWGIGAQAPFEDIVAAVYHQLGLARSESLDFLAGRAPTAELAPRPGGYRVALVDGDARGRGTLVAAIERAYPHYAVHAYASGDALLGGPELDALHLLMLDIDAEVDVRRTISAARTVWGDGLPVIATSRRDRREVGAELLARDDVMFVPRPFELDFVVGMVGGSIEGQAGARSVHDARRLSLAPGEVLFEEGDEGSSVYLVVTGRLTIERQRGERVIHIGEVGPGGIVGELAFLNDAPRAARVRTEDAAEVLELDLDHVRGYLDAQPVWLRTLIRSLVGHLHRTDEILSEVSTSTEEGAVA